MHDMIMQVALHSYMRSRLIGATHPTSPQAAGGCEAPFSGRGRERTHSFMLKCAHAALMQGALISDWEVPVRTAWRIVSASFRIQRARPA